MPADAIRQGAAKTPQPVSSSGTSSVSVKVFRITISFREQIRPLEHQRECQCPDINATTGFLMIPD